MSKWNNIKISNFLYEREGIYKPNNPKVKNLKRLQKIDFAGNIHFVDKKSKTNMIIIKQGDLVISGINVSKGALAVYEGKEDITATIHYSSYTFNRNKISIDFLKLFLKSPKFIQLLKNQVKGGIKTEIKPKHILSLEIKLPDKSEQEKIVNVFNNIEKSIVDLNNKIINQQSLIKHLYQTILQEAIEGKLTADWRKKHPELFSGENSAENLLKKIKKEKEQLIKEKKIEKQNPLPLISEEEKPFKLPEGWIWTRLGNIYNFKYGKGLSKIKRDDNGKYPVYGSNGIVGFYNKYLTEKRSIIVGRKGSCGEVNISTKPSWTTDVAYYIEENKNIHFYFSAYLLESLNLTKYSKGVKPGINRKKVYSVIIAFPSFYEQKIIIERVKILMSMIDELEKQVIERKEETAQLVHSVLREAFE
jgi:type I restriction enzyme S subunit